MSELDKDKVLEDFSKAYKASNGKKPTIDANNGWYSVNDGKNMRLAELDAWTKELEKESAKKAPTDTQKKTTKGAQKASTEKVKNKAPKAENKAPKSGPKNATKQSAPQASKPQASTQKSSRAQGGENTAGLSAKEAWKQYLDNQDGDSTMPRGVN